MPDLSASPPDTGRRFELYECLGRGGFGEVYRASMVMASGVRTVVAVKVLRKGLDPFGQSVQRLRDEAHLLSALDHPAILKVHDLVLLDERVGLVTEYVEGVDLSHVLHKGVQEFGHRALAEVIAEVANALEAAWSRQVAGKPMQLVHRDIKPANIRLGRHGQVKLLDFGIARANIERSASTTTDTLLGTYQYMAPERFGGDAGPRGDVFALGCLFYEGLAGKRFLNGLSLQQHYAVVADRGNFDPILAEQIGLLPSIVPMSTRSLLAHILAYDPDERPSAGDLAAMCEAEATYLRGNNLKTWARERDWAFEPRAGDLTGRVIAESRVLTGPSGNVVDASIPQATMPASETMPMSVETVDSVSTLSAARRRRSDTPWWVWVLLLVSIAVVGSGVVTLTAGVVVQQAWPEPAPQPAPTVPATPPDPVAPTPVVPDPAPAVDPVDPDPNTLEVEPDPVPDAVPVPDPEPEPAPTGPVPVGGRASVRVDSPVPVQLVDAHGVRHTGGDLWPGTYVIRADFGSGFERSGSATLESGRSYTVRCRKLMRTCGVD